LNKLRAVVIGAGPAGAAAAYGLCEQGYEVTVFEKGAAPGGRTRTYREGRFQLDTGAAFVTNFYPRIFELAQKIGFADAIQEMVRISGLHHAGQTAELNVGSTVSFLKFPFLGLGDKIKMAKWTAGLTLKKNRYDLAVPGTLIEEDSLSIGDYARKNLNERIYDFLIRPGIEPFWYFSCEDVSAGMIVGLTSKAAGARFYYFKNGIDELARQLMAKVTLQCNSEVTHLQHHDDRFSLNVKSSGEEKSHEFNRVVIATTASVAHRLCEDLPLTLVSDSQRKFLNSQKYVSNIHVAYRAPKLSNKPTVGSIFPAGPGQHPVAALSFHSIKDLPDEHHEDELISLYLSDTESRRLMHLSDADIYTHVLSLARQIHPDISSESEPFYLVRRTEAIPVHEVGRYTLADDFQKEQQANNGALRFCGDYLATATVEGAVTTGLTAVQA
jgi:protoporphyrinogen/coproporphyrinogen III oxidase